MGRVFSWEEVKRGMLPKISSFKEAEALVRRELKSNKGVVGALLFGSALHGKANMRSDVDCIVVYETNKRRSVLNDLANITSFVDQRFYVPIQFIPVDLEIAKAASLHNIGPLFADHLQRAVKAGGTIKKQILPLFAIGNDRQKDIESYFRNKLRTLEKHISAFALLSQGEVNRFLQKVLESPVVIARKLLQWLGVDMPDDSKKEVVRLYPQIATDEEQAFFTRITDVDKRYTQLLEYQATTPPNEIAHREIFAQITDSITPALDFAHLSARRLA